MSATASSFIEKKRDGYEHSQEEIADFIDGFVGGSVADYQMSAWLMAVFLRGMSEAETVALTHSMLHSGQTITRSSSGAPRIDKHSTGGVGDKVSLPLVGIAAACGLHVPMIAGRGLGHTGGTLDKLESIPGFSVRLGVRAFERIVERAGACIIGQTKTIAPADRRMYSLRDVTATVACRPLIVASILSKKLAAGLDGLVLDVKVGRGAFMKDKKPALALARDLVRVSNQLGTPSVAQLSDMDRPLGTTIGNAIEVRESIAILRGEGPIDSTRLTLELVADMLLLAKSHANRPEALAQARSALDSGRAFEKFGAMVELQGGDRRAVDDPKRLPQAKYRVTVRASQGGYVSDVDPLALALLAQDMGAGRRLVTDDIDHAVGIELHAKTGRQIERNDLLCTLHTQHTGARRAAQIERARAAFSISDVPAVQRKLLFGRVI